jgi:uncharacterized protein YggE
MTFTAGIARWALALLFSVSLFTPIQADPPVRKVTVVGSAIIKVAPDEMLWSMQISFNDATLAKSKDRHDIELKAALDYIKSLGDAVKDLQTGGIRFDKNLYPGDNAFLKAHPFSCSTQVTFTLTDFDKYGAVADKLSSIDGVQVQGVDYASSKDDETKREALKKALLNARDKANDLAVTAGCYIDKPLEIIEGSPEGGPRPMFAPMGMAKSMGTPAAVPGQLEISASVTATYDLFYK